MQRVSTRAIAAALLFVTAVVGADDESLPRPVIEPVTFDGADAGMPWLAPLADGGVVMSWTRLAEDGPRLEYARHTGDGWSASNEVARQHEGQEWFVNWADFPSIIELDDGRLAAHYLVSSGPGVFAYDVHVVSQDANGRWPASTVPHRDGTPTEHGFVSMLPWGGDALKAVWLDGRHTHTGDTPGHGGPMTLRSAVLGEQGLSDEHEIDASVCDCCQTSAVRLPGGRALVAYRDRSEEEVRDIAVARFGDGGWSAPKTVHHDGWQIHGCPVNGPAMAAHGEHIALAWFTLVEDEPRVQLAFSEDGGDTWSSPVRVHDARAVGRVDMVMLDPARALVSWIERVDGTARIRVRVAGISGALGDAVTVDADAALAGRATGFPRMARTGDGDVLIAWTAADEGRRSVEVRRVTGLQPR